MSGNVDVGDAIELTFTSTPGATVVMSWFDPNVIAALDQVPVAENPVGSGKYPMTLTPSAPGMWEARFYATGTVTAVESFWVRAVSVTGPPPLATVGEVKEQFGSMSLAQEGLAGSLLRAASKIVRQQYPALDRFIGEGRLDPEVVGLAVVNMVLRVLRNPRGLRAETTGPFSVTYDTTTAVGELVVSSSEAALLVPRRVVGGVKGVAGTIRVTPGLPLPPGYRRGW